MAETTNSADNDKMLAAVSSIPIVGLIIWFAMKDASAYVKNYAKQGAVLFIFGLLAIIPIVNCVVLIVEVVCIIVLLVNALQENKTFRLPVVADIADKIFK
jgi:uncharacterized membrane protein